MRSRTTLASAGLAAAALLAAGGLAIAAAAAVPGKPARGKTLFVRPGLFCGSCHTLKAANSTGKSGPDLDKVRPAYPRIVRVVTSGLPPSRHWPTGMPAYGVGRHRFMTKAEIEDVAAFIYTATHR